MWVVWNGKVCIMLYDTKRKRSVFIPERKWDGMSAKERERYV